MTQLDLFAPAEPETPPELPAGPAVGFLARLESRMRRADERAARGDTELLNGRLFWALIRALQVQWATLCQAPDHYLDGRRHELLPILGAEADSAMFEWLNPTVRTVNRVAAIVEATVVLQLLGDGPPASSGPFNRVVAVDDEWRSVAPWWQGLTRRSWRTVGPRWIPWCETLPAGKPTGVLVWRPPADRPFMVPDDDEVVEGVAAWYRAALGTGRRWVCAHGWTHHPRRGDRDVPLSCSRRMREDDCDRCCLLANPYRKAEK